MRILIVEGGLQAISTARSLRDVGYEVGIWSQKENYAYKSSAISLKGKSIGGNPIEELIDFTSKEGFRVIIPMSDKSAFLLSKNKNIIESSTGSKVAVPSLDTLTMAADKQLLMKFLKQNNYPHPITFSEDEIFSSPISQIPFPLLIKPNNSVGARGIVKVNNIDEVKSKLGSIKDKYGECHFQEYISGNFPYFNVMLYRDKEGNCINYVVLEIIRFFPLSGGSSCMCKTVEKPDLVHLCSNVLKDLNYYGFADFDILQNSNGEYKIIEINPRVPASLRGAAISGVNFPALIVADQLNLPLPKFSYSPGKTLRYLGLDIMWFLKSPKRFKTHPSWFKFFGSDIFYQEGGYNDWKAMLSVLISNLNKIEFKNGKFRKKD